MLKRLNSRVLLWHRLICLSLLCLFFVYANLAFAAPLAVQGSADVGRILLPNQQLQAPKVTKTPIAPTLNAGQPTIRDTNQPVFLLKKVVVKGNTVFTTCELEPIYDAYINKKVNISVASNIAALITQKYQTAGYFLSLAYVENYNSKKGIVYINVVEGYIGQVELTDKLANMPVLKAYIKKIINDRPIKTLSLESHLLRLNDLPGLSFRAVLMPLKAADQGAVKLKLIPIRKISHGNITFDNFGSRFLGPNQVASAYGGHIFALTQTTLSGLSSLPTDELKYGTLSHTMAIAPDFTLNMNGGITKANPGFSLKNFEIDSAAKSLSLNLKYQWIRQREKNLALDLTLDTKNVASDILSTVLTREKTRVARLSATYNTIDSLNGVDIVNLTVSHGIAAFGASQAGDLNLSRAQAKPSFAKAAIAASRLQNITDTWALSTSLAGQYATEALYSSEEFGYGGQTFGRAYDSSEITGDKGASAMLELRYNGWNALDPISIQPYSYYDVGTAWNVDQGQAKRASGASAGFGARLATSTQQSADIGVAWPLTRSVETPIYGANPQGPRLYLQVSQAF